MRKLSFVLSILAIAVALHASTEAISVLISSPRSAFSLGQPIVITVCATNKSQAEIKLTRSLAPRHAEITYRVTLVDSDGRPVPRTHYGEAAEKHHLIVTRTIVPLAPGATLSETMDLRQLFQITNSGTYTVQTGRRWPRKSTNMAWSNTLTLTITK